VQQWEVAGEVGSHARGQSQEKKKKKEKKKKRKRKRREKKRKRKEKKRKERKIKNRKKDGEKYRKILENRYWRFINIPEFLVRKMVHARVLRSRHVYRESRKGLS